MKHLLSFLFCLNFVYTSAQQNYINVPSTEVTKKGKLFFQQQLNFNELIQSNTTLDYGLGNGFEIGANVLGLNFNDKSKSFIKNDTNDVDPYNPLLMINGLKRFNIKENVAGCIGSQLGLNFRDHKQTTPANLVYGNILFESIFSTNSNLVIGGYYNSIHYAGRYGNRIGGWIGSEIKISQNIHLITESIIGNNSLCYTSFGCVYYLTKKMPITLGLQIPNTKKNSYSLVFEFTFVP